jgi:hypothetical protein
LGLQEAIAVLVRSAEEINHFDVMAYRETGQWGGKRIPDDMNQRAFEAGVELNKYVVRIEDAEFRRLVCISFVMRPIKQTQPSCAQRTMHRECSERKLTHISK